MLNQVYDELSTKVFQTGGDSMDSTERATFEKFLGDMKAVGLRISLTLSNTDCCFASSIDYGSITPIHPYHGRPRRQLISTKPLRS